MPLSYVLEQVGNKIGLDPAVTTERSTLLRFANEAADELWAECDILGSLEENTFRVNGDQTISMPMWVGRVRAVRDAQNRVVWHLNQMRPRYNELNWIDGWYNYRLKNTQALMATITNISTVNVTVPFVENPPITVSLSGSTATASNISEDVVMNALSVPSVNSFTNITSCKKNTVNACDITVTDADGKLLTIIPNNSLAAQYQILDISGAPWLPQVTGPFDNYVEILFKKALPWFSLDDQEFPAQGYDNQWVNKCLQLWNEEATPVGPQAALAYDAKATRGLARKKTEQNLPTEDRVSFVQNPHESLQPRIRGRRFTLWNGRRRG